MGRSDRCAPTGRSAGRPEILPSFDLADRDDAIPTRHPLASYSVGSRAGAVRDTPGHRGRARCIDEDGDAARDPLDEGRERRPLSLRCPVAVDDRREPLVRRDHDEVRASNAEVVQRRAPAMTRTRCTRASGSPTRCACRRRRSCTSRTARAASGVGSRSARMPGTSSSRANRPRARGSGRRACRRRRNRAVRSPDGHATTVADEAVLVIACLAERRSEPRREGTLQERLRLGCWPRCPLRRRCRRRGWGRSRRFRGVRRWARPVPESVRRVPRSRRDR